jgi:uncharacterized protein (TIGR02265 family)
MSSGGRVILSTTIEGTLKGLGPLNTPALRAMLRARGLDVEALPPAVPVEVWGPCLLEIGRFAWPQVSDEEALRRLGQCFIRGWQRTPIGSAASGLLRLLGPRQTLMRLDRAFRTADNFSRSETVLDGPRTALVRINQVDGRPTFWVGVFEAGLEVVGRKGTATLVSHEPPAAVLRLEWD